VIQGIGCILAFMPEREESDQLPEEGSPGEVPDDEGDQGTSRDEAEEQAGAADDDGDEGEGQATGNPKSAG
jgi:hypothetical protein